MKLNDSIAILGMQVLSVGLLAIWWMGVHLIWQGHRSNGCAYLVFATPMILLWSYIALCVGWVGFGLIIVFPALASIPVYWLYRHSKQSRVFIWIIIALETALFALVVSLYVASSGDGSIGYWGLAAGALGSGLSVYLWRKYTLRTPVPDDRQRARSGCWATVGTILGLTVGAALVRGAIEVLAPEFRAAVEAFFGGWLAFSILGCAGWQFLWEIRKQGRGRVR